MVEADESKGAAAEPAEQRCAACGKLVQKTYQNDTCKGCLVQSFRKHIQLIDHFRDLKR